MAGKPKSIADVLSGKSERTILNKALVESSGGLLDAIPAYGPNGKPLDPKKEVWTDLGRAPKKEEIDNCRTPTEMILRGRAILKDGRRVSWQLL